MSNNQAIHLILVRHGNTFESGEIPTQVGAKTDLLLTSQGRTQAKDFAQFISSASIHPKALFAGSLKRQTESAQIVANQLHLDNKLHLNIPALNEIDYGLWEGLTAEEIASRWPQEYADWTQQSKWPTNIFGSTLEAHLSAITQWIELLRKSYVPGDSILGVTSNGIIRLFYFFQKETWERLKNAREMEKLKVKTGHYCEIMLWPNELEIVSWNKDPKKL